MSDERILVVGTTSDYIDLIQRRHPGRALFLTDRAHRAEAIEPAPSPADEVLSDLSVPATVLTDLELHLRERGTRLSGIACYDCDSLLLAAELGRALGLSYPTAPAVAACRSKYASKRLWREADVPCPAAAQVKTLEEAAAFLERTGAPAVLKPLDSSGSELTFLVRDARDLAQAYACIQARHAAAIPGASPIPRSARLAPPAPSTPRAAGAVTPLPRTFVVEEYIAGPEYSADFLLDEEGCRVVRVASKVMAPAPLGTALAYRIPADPPPPLTLADLEHAFGRAARSLGLERTPAMVDFIVRDGVPVMIEIAPRPGGDCLPPLIRASCGLDMLGLAIDFAARRPIDVPPRGCWRSLAGLRLLARQEGEVVRFDDSALRADPRVIECHLTRRPGHRVALPPRDYDSRVFGYAVFQPDAARPLDEQCLELSDKLAIEWTAPQPLTMARGPRDANPRPGGTARCPA